MGRGKKEKSHPVHCLKCGWEGRRTHGPLKPCPKCNSHVARTFTGKTKPKKKKPKAKK